MFTTLACALAMQAPVTVRLDFDRPGVAVSPVLYGLMTEEINHSYDGGLYAEQIRNRSFRDNAENPVHWSAVGASSELALDRDNAKFGVSLRFKGAVANAGYWGMAARPNTQYTLAVWARADAGTDLQATLESSSGTRTFGSARVRGVGTEWKRFEVKFRTGNDFEATKDARLALRAGDGRTVWLGFTSLFPPTYKNRKNGNRPDLMRMMADMKPKFLRFPGGNYLQGNLIDERFKWWETLGPVEERKGHPAPWGYRSSDGLGMLEFLLWCKDLNIEPLLVVYAGYSLRGDYIKPGPDLVPYIQEALDQIEYCVGGPETKGGKLRARDGHPEPFPLKYVQVGNEDGFDKSGSYEDRFVQYYDAIRAKYPDLKIISSTGGTDYLGSKFPINKRRPDLWDEHYYVEAWDMMGMATKYDSYDRKGPKVFVGEWAAHDTVAPWQAGPNAGPTPNMKCTLADAAFMTGMERNSDIVEMACYAPLFVNVNPGGRQWSLNLIGYDALESFGSPSYYAQKMFAENLGDRTVELTLSNVPEQTKGESKLPAIFASATRNTKSGELYVKVVNALPTPQRLNLAMPGAKARGNVAWTELTGELTAVNTLAEPKKVAPTSKRVALSGENLDVTLAGYSVNVFRIPGARR